MKLNCFLQSVMNWLTCAKLSIALVLSLFLVSSSTAGEYDIQLQDISDNLAAVLTYLNDSIGLSSSTSSSLWEMLDSEGQTVDEIRAFMLGENLGYVPSHNRQGTLPWYLWSLNSAIWGLGTQTTPNGQWSIYKDLQTILDNDDLRNTRLTQIRDILRQLTNSSSATSVLLTNFVNVSVSPTSIVNVSGGRFDDVLAANPWWTTNSSFVMSKQWLTQISPPDGDTQPSTRSFQEFLSHVAAKLNNPNNIPTSGKLSVANWSNMWGLTNATAWGNNARYGWLGNYTWFDFIGDWHRSNAVASSTYNARLLDALRSISNVVSSSSSSVFVTNDVFVSLTNLVSVLVTNNVSLRADDILAGNPWWATNSVFVPDWSDWTWGDNEFGEYPRPTFADMDIYTFPDILSALMSSRSRNFSSFTELAGYGAPSLWWNQFGHENYPGSPEHVFNLDMAGLYTFEDFVADAMKSNLVLLSSLSTSYQSLTSSASAYPSDDLDNLSSNALPSYSLPSLQEPSTLSAMLDFGTDNLAAPTDGNPEFVVVPDFNIGGIQLQEFKGTLAIPPYVQNVIHTVVSWLWRVLFVVAVWRLIQVEYTFWVTLGNAEGST